MSNREERELDKAHVCRSEQLWCETLKRERVREGESEGDIERESEREREAERERVREGE